MVEQVLRFMPRSLRATAGELIAGQSERSRSGRGAIQAFGIRVVSAGLAFVSQVILARLMGTFEFGIFTTAWVWVTILGTLSSLGFATSVLRFLPQYRAQQKPDYFRGFLLAGRLIAGTAGGLAMGIGLLVIGLAPGIVAPHYELPLTLALLCLPAYAVTDFQDGIGRAQGWIDLALGPPYIARPILLLAGTAIAFGLGASQTANIVAGAAMIATSLTAIGQYLAERHRQNRTLTPGPRSYALSAWMRLSLPLLLIDGLTLLMLNLDVLILNLFTGPEDVAIYFAAARTISLVSFVHFAVGAVAGPRFATLHAGRRQAEISGCLRQMQKWSVLPSAAAAAVLLILGEPLLALFGEAFTQAYPVMFVLAMGLILRALAGPAQNLLVVTGHQNTAALILMITVFLNAGLCLALIPAMGLMGAATATAAAFGFEAMATIMVARRRFGHGRAHL
jgi:O-antigen/teichoic acid export membrane protein